MISGRSGWGGDVGRQPRSLRPGLAGSHRVSLAAIVQNQIVFSWAKGGSHVLCTIHDDARITISQSNDVERIPILGLESIPQEQDFAVPGQRGTDAEQIFLQRADAGLRRIDSIERPVRIVRLDIEKNIGGDEEQTDALGFPSVLGQGRPLPYSVPQPFSCGYEPARQVSRPSG